MVFQNKVTNTAWILIQSGALRSTEHWLQFTGMAACEKFIEGV